MKKIPKSIRRVIVDTSDGLALALACDRKEEKYLRQNKEFFKGRVPSRPYSVTFTINPRGAYQVEGRSLYRDGEYSTVCFLDLAWDGLRVSRKVTPIRKVGK